MKLLINKVVRKLSFIKRKYVYNIKNILLNGVASSIFTPPYYENLFTNSLGTK